MGKSLWAPCRALHATMVWFSSFQDHATFNMIFFFSFLVVLKYKNKTGKNTLVSTLYEHFHCCLKLLQEKDNYLKSCTFFHE